MNQRQFKGFLKKKAKRVGDSAVPRERIVKQITWQRFAIGTERSSFKGDTVGIIGARWRRRLVWKEKGVQAYKDIKTYNDIKKK